MSILIRNMEMPKSCGDCKVFVCYRQWAGDVGDCFCGITKNDANAKEKNADCPLVPVPKPHGRLIDADALMNEMDKQENAMYEHGREFSFSFKSGGDVCTAWYNVEMMVEDAPTIIPADPKEEGE